VGVFCFVSFAYGVVFGIRSELPQLDQTRKHRIERDGLIYASDGHTVLARLVGEQSRKWVASKDIPPVMKQAIVAIEDKRFFEHQGLDLHGIARALWQDISNKKIVQGGSTITQQFVKNAYVTSKRSLSRKLKEAMLAWQLEQRARHDKEHGKDWILTQYLNTIYFGNGAYGIERAAQVYFGHRAKTLTLTEAALLAGIPADPSVYNPVTNPQAARARRHDVLQAMLDQKDVTYNEYRLANRTPLPEPEDIRQPGFRGPAQYFVDYVKQQLVDRYGTRQVFGGGLRVVTTIDLELQRRARAAIAKWLPGPGPSAALVAIDPRDGRVLSMVGGDNYRESQFNLAVQGERQAGSAFKPFVLATALEQGISPTTVLESKPVTISLGDRDWYVQNYEGSNLGPIDLTNATVYSDNTVYAQLTRIVGPSSVAETAHQLGITRDLNPYFAIGLGADPVSPLEMARAYASFANGGERIDGSILQNHPRVVVSVSGNKNRPVKHPAISETNAAIVNSILQQVVQSGTGKRAALPDGRPVAGKTGTTENYGDAWFVGYTPQLVVAVWVGYPTMLRPMLTEYHGEAVAGGTFPALIWKSFMESALPYLKDEPESFPAPQVPPDEPRRLVLRDGIFQLDNGLCRNTISVQYFAGQTPAETAQCKPNEVEIPNVVGASYEVARARLTAQPLTPVVVYKPAAAGQRLHVVVRQIPPRGRLSSFDRVTIVFAKPLHGVVPKVVGLRLPQARKMLERLKLRPVLKGSGLKIVRQRPGPGVAAGPGLPVTVWVRGG
jgi:penicillin-binding protein 1A